MRLPCTRRMHQTPRGRGPSRDIFGPGVCGACCGRRASVASSTRSSLVSIGETRRDTVNRTCRAPRAMRPAPRPRRPASRADVCASCRATQHTTAARGGAPRAWQRRGHARARSPAYGFTAYGRRYDTPRPRVCSGAGRVSRSPRYRGGQGVSLWALWVSAARCAQPNRTRNNEV